MKKSLATLILAGALLAPVSAFAIPMTLDFTINSYAAWNGVDYEDTSYAGHAVGEAGSGWVTFDDALGTFVDTDNGRVAIDLGFSWLGHTYDETTARIWVLTFDSNGLTEWGLGSLTGGCNLNCWANPGPTDMVMLTGGPAGSPGGITSLHIEGASGAMLGTITWTLRESSVPEPATLGLFGLGLLGAAAARRRRVV
jgi:hypothetical protein